MCSSIVWDRLSWSRMFCMCWVQMSHMAMLWRAGISCMLLSCSSGSWSLLLGQ